MKYRINNASLGQAGGNTIEACDWKACLQPQNELSFYHPQAANTSSERWEWKQESKQMAS